jgi:hypothetical protein
MRSVPSDDRVTHSLPNRVLGIEKHGTRKILREVAFNLAIRPLWIPRDQTGIPAMLSHASAHRPMTSDPSPPVASASIRRWHAMAIAVVAFVAFANSLGNYFMIDDYWFLQWSGAQRWSEVFKPYQFGGREEYGKYWFNASRLSGHSGEAYFRPLVSVLFKTIHTWFGLDARAYHLSSIALHVLNSVIVLWVAGLFFRAREPAFITALAFAVHPAHAEPVQWLAANTHLIVAPFYLLSLGFYLRSRDAEGHWWHYALALGCALLALCAHELAVTLPAVLLVADWWRAQPDHARNQPELPVNLWRLARRVLPFAIIAGTYLAWHFDVLRSLQTQMAGSAYLHDVSHPFEFACSAIFQLTYGLSHLFLPLPFAPVDAHDLEPLLGRIPLALVCTAVLALLVWLWTKMGGRDLRVLVAGTLFLIPFAPSLLVSPAERQLYVPSVGFCLLLGLLYERLSTRERLLRTTVVVLALLAVVLAWAYNVMWSFPSNVARAQVAELRQQLPTPERDSSIYLLNLWGPAFGMEIMPGLLAGNPKLDVQVLTIHPKLLPVGEYRVSNPLLQRFFAAVLPGAVGEAQVESHWESPDVLRVQIRNGRFMRSLIEQTYPAAPSVQVTGARVEMDHFTAEVVSADADGVETLRFYFQPGRKRVIFDLQGGRVKQIVPE